LIIHLSQLFAFFITYRKFLIDHLRFMKRCLLFIMHVICFFVMSIIDLDAFFIESHFFLQPSNDLMAIIIVFGYHLKKKGIFALWQMGWNVLNIHIPCLCYSPVIFLSCIFFHFYTFIHFFVGFLF